MANESRGTDAGVNQTPIYVDDKGRRRRGDVNWADPNNLSDGSKVELALQRMSAMEQRLAKVESELQQAKNDLSGMKITGPGFAGQGPGGISFNPTITVQAYCDDGTINGTVTLA